MDPTGANDPSLEHVRGRMEVIRARVQAVVAARRLDDEDPDDPYRGLYVSDGHVASILAADGWIIPPPDAQSAADLAAVEQEADMAGEHGNEVRLRTLAHRFGLDALDMEILLIALAPDLDARFERLYIYLNDDVTRRHATVGLALELIGLPTGDGRARARLGPGAPLRQGNLITLEADQERGLLTRLVRVPERVIAHLIGDDTIDPLVQPLQAPTVEISFDMVDHVAAALIGEHPAVYLVDEVGSASVAVGASALRKTSGVAPLVVDLTRLPVRQDVPLTIQALVREARLGGAGIVAGPIAELQELDRPSLRHLVDAPLPRVLIGTAGWDTAWGTTVPLVLDGPAPDLAERERLWRDVIQTLNEDTSATIDPAAATIAFRLTPEQIERSARAAAIVAASQGRPVRDQDLRLGARAQNAVGLERLATRIEPRATWDDLVVGPKLMGGLRELAARSRHRDLVLGEWGMGSKTARGRGVTGLLAGESGTGKTMSAEVVAGDLGLDLYVIDLSTIIDKYIGETEKNLDKVFGQADRVNGVLLFDEADALFGKRSDVSDAHDRHANVEVAYLLQRMEQFDGIALLTTNLRSNIDDAFTRRLDAILEFQVPDENERLRMWTKHLTGRLPLDDDVDLPFLAQQFRLVGGEIRNIAVTAAYLAAERGGPVKMLDLINATAREYRKLGRLTVAAEFGGFADTINGGSSSNPAKEARNG